MGNALAGVTIWKPSAAAGGARALPAVQEVPCPHPRVGSTESASPALPEPALASSLGPVLLPDEAVAPLPCAGLPVLVPVVAGLPLVSAVPEALPPLPEEGPLA